MSSTISQAREKDVAATSETSSNRPRLLLLITEDWYFWSHRRSIARGAQAAGFKVLVATRAQNHGDRIEAEGFQLVPIKLRRRSRNPFSELSAIGELVSIYRSERPTIVHHVGIKPVLYGSIAAYLASVPAVVNALAGLGYLFVAQGIKAPLLRLFARSAYKLALRKKCSRVIFQNREDYRLFTENSLVKEHQAVLIRGSGVNLKDFAVSAESNGVPVVMLAGRLLWNKGIGELVQATQILRGQGMNCRLVLVGLPDNDNPMAVPESVLRKWTAEGTVEWWGRREDMPNVLPQANVVALPTTYGEGVPKILLEATACGRAIVATDEPGCREIVRHGVNGLLVPPHDRDALKGAIQLLLEDAPLRAKMGARGRQIAETEFSESRVVQETVAIYDELLRECRI